MPRHYLNQWWNIVNWTPRNKLQISLNNIKTFLFKKIHLKLSPGKWQPYRLGDNELRTILIYIRYCNGIVFTNYFIYVLYLQEVDLHANAIRQIKASAFSGLPKLSKLVLKANRLIAPPSLIFIQATLRYLDMSANNLTYIPKSYFDGCSVLEMIFLNSNKLSTIPNLEFVTDSVQGIDLNVNHIVDVAALYDNKYPRLRILKLNGNNLREFWLPSRVFTLELDALMLHGNKLTTIQLPKDFHGTDLQLRDNPWHCDQSLSSIRECFLIDHHLTCPRDVTLDLLKCDSPPNLQGMSPLNVGKTFDGIAWKRFLHYRLIVRGSHHSSVVSLTMGQ